MYLQISLYSDYSDTLPEIIYEEVIKNVSSLPKIQHDFPYPETPNERLIREFRKESVKQGFLHAWKGYVKYAWGDDEVKPLTNKSKNNFNGWGATMVDALDTMWIMDLKDEFYNATRYVANVDFTKSHMEINVFETVIRYLGGLLSAHELSGNEILLRKAKELGDAIIPSFSSRIGLPYNRWNITKGLKKKYKPNITEATLAEIGTLQLEYFKLIQLTGNSTYFDKVHNIIQILDRAKKRIPGFYPIRLNIDNGKFTTGEISFGGAGDSFYEYLIKDYIYTGGAIDQYRRMYEESIDSMHKYLVKEGQVKDHPDLLFIGQYNTDDYSFEPRMEHLTCFVPGMLAIGSKILNRPKDLEVAIRSGEACYWAYNSTSTGIGPEEFYFLEKGKHFNPHKHKHHRTTTRPTIQHQPNREEYYLHKLPDGIYDIDGKYLLRPETVESLFILYRVTGDKSYQEKGWKIWQSIEKWCKTPTAYSGLYNVTGEAIVKNDNMESFFLAETLKYLYLLFSTPDVISLDTYVFNTEAHPFLRMKPQ